MYLVSIQSSILLFYKYIVNIQIVGWSNDTVIPKIIMEIMMRAEILTEVLHYSETNIDASAMKKGRCRDSHFWRLGKSMRAQDGLYS